MPAERVRLASVPILPAQTDAERADSVEEAAQAVRRGQVVVLPTDTVYGIGADAFNHDAVATLLTAKGRGRSMPGLSWMSSGRER